MIEVYFNIEPYSLDVKNTLSPYLGHFTMLAQKWISNNRIIITSHIQKNWINKLTFFAGGGEEGQNNKILWYLFKRTSTEMHNLLYTLFHIIMLLHCLKYIWKYGKRVFLHCTPHTLVMNRCLYTKSTYIAIHWLPKPSMDNYDASWGFSLEYYCVRLNCIKYAIQWCIWALPFFCKSTVLPSIATLQPFTASHRNHFYKCCDLMTCK